MNRYTLGLSILATTLGFGCQNQNGTGNVSTAPTHGSSTIQRPALDPARTACNSMGGNTGLNNGTEHGLVARARTIPNGVTPPTTVAGYLQTGVLLDALIYFDRVFVPTRPWTAGFETLNGNQIQGAQNQPVFEYFSLSFESKVGLADFDQVGLYQFAVLADDGAILKIKSGDAFTTLVNNDGNHQTKFACASTTVAMSRTSRLPIQLDYFQGPRYHIAATLLWREVANSTAAALADSECGQSGNGRYFNSAQVPPAAQNAWDGLMNRGWKPLDPKNYFLSDNVAENPCTNDGQTCQGTGCDGGFGV